MSVIAVRKDPSTLTMTITSEFPATRERVWQLWADPRQLERWWGPPTYPATVTHHELVEGGRVEYHMTGPTGDQPRGYWRIESVDPPSSLEFRDGFAGSDGSPDTNLPTVRIRVTIEGTGQGATRMSVTSTFPDLPSMERLIAMGMEQGMTAALEQIDAILAESGR